MSAVVGAAEDLTADWFTAVLRASGALQAGVVSAVDVEPVGSGQMARMMRAVLSYDTEPGGPASLVVKFPSADEGSVALARALGMYELETRFYAELRPLVPELSVPDCLHAAVDPSSGQFTLVLEDLSGRTRPGDVLTTCDEDDCAAVLAELVRFQAPLWNSTQLSRLTWLDPGGRTHGVFDSFAAGLEPFLARFGDGLPADHIRLFERVLPRAGEWVRGWGSPMVVQHGDFRTDNLLFGVHPDAPRVTVIDFQSIRPGPPGVDLAYFLGSALPTERRREFERDLISRYHRGLVESGVDDHDADRCWHSYREGALYGVILFVGVATRVAATERGDRLIADQIRRYADMAIDLDAARAGGIV